MSTEDLVARLIKQRPLHFTNQYDYTMLRDGTELLGREEWLHVGTTDEHYNKHIKLAEYLSYDEMILASLLGTSGPSYFINDGRGDNCSVPGDLGTFETRGIMVGLVGARFQCPGHMDAALCLPPDCEKPKYLQHPRLTKIIQEWLGEKPGYVTVGADDEYDDELKFDDLMYKARMRISSETLLLEANSCAVEEDRGRKAYVHLVGLGLGVWMYCEDQIAWFVEEVTATLQRLSLPHDGTLELAWIDAD